jgi:hypothetical protein
MFTAIVSHLFKYSWQDHFSVHLQIHPLQLTQHMQILSHLPTELGSLICLNHPNSFTQGNMLMELLLEFSHQ